MRIVITGGTGLIGKALVGVLAPRSHEIFVLSRNPAQAQQAFRASGLAGVRTVAWDARTVQGWGGLISMETAIVNLAGATPAPRHWTTAFPRRLPGSRFSAR